jgi:hypothetical protein
MERNIGVLDQLVRILIGLVLIVVSAADVHARFRSGSLAYASIDG